MSGRERLLHGVVVTAIVTSAVLVGMVSRLSPVLAIDGASRFVPLEAHRLVDTDEPDIGYTRTGLTTLHVPVVGASEVPDDAVAVMLSLDVGAATAVGYATVYPSGTAHPAVSVVNIAPMVPAVTTAVVRLGDDGAIDVFHSAPARVRLSVVGYFEAAATAVEGRFIGMSQRLLDTRSGSAMVAGVSRRVTVPLPIGSEWVVLNVAAVLAMGPGSIEIGAWDSPSPKVPALRVGGYRETRTGLVVVPVHDGQVELQSTMATHALIDVVGYFTGVGSSDSSDGLFVPTDAQRLRDTRLQPPRLWTNGTQEVTYGVVGAGAVWANYAAVNAYSSGNLVAWAAGTAQPAVSTLNTVARATVANASITRLSDRGLSVRSTTETNLVVDCFGWFTGAPVTATRLPLPNDKYPHVLSPGPGQVALTFDDGPHPATTPVVVSILEQKRVGGTFFVIGGLAERYPSVAAGAFRLGHSIQSHTYSHRRLRSLTSAQIIDELRHANRIITGITGRTPVTYRPPYGSTDARVRSVTSSIGMHEVMWNSSAGMLSPADEMIAMIRGQASSAKARGVGLTVLFHDGSGCRGCTVKALPVIIDILKAQGWQFVVLG